MTPTFGAVLRRERLRARLGQAELAARAGITARTVSMLETGFRDDPHASTIVHLAEALDIEPAVLLEPFTRRRPVYV